MLPSRRHSPYYTGRCSAPFGKALHKVCATFVSGLSLERNVVQQYSLQKMVLPVPNCRNISKKSLLHNDATPRIDVNPENYEVEGRWAARDLRTCPGTGAGPAIFFILKLRILLLTISDMLIQEKIGNLHDPGADPGARSPCWCQSDPRGREIDWVELEWYEADKRVLRKRTRSGRDLALKFLGASPAFMQGDILYASETHLIAVEILPARPSW